MSSKGLTIGTPVRITRAGSAHEGRTGVLATDRGMWNDGTSGDRVVIMDDTRERLVFEGWMIMDATPVVSPEVPDTTDELRAVTVGYRVNGLGPDTPVRSVTVLVGPGQSLRTDAPRIIAVVLWSTNTLAHRVTLVSLTPSAVNV